MELDEFKQISRLVNVGDDLWDLYADLLERKQSLYIRRCVGVNQDQALLDGYKDFTKALQGDKSPRVFVKNNTPPVTDIENNLTFTPIKNNLWQK